MKDKECCIQDDDELVAARQAYFSGGAYKGYSGDTLKGHIDGYKNPRPGNYKSTDIKSDMPMDNKATIKKITLPYS